MTSPREPTSRDADDTPGVPFDPVPLVAKTLGIAPSHVASTIALLIEGATVPFIARYRKEATGGLDEVQVRAIEEQRDYVVELDARRQTVLAEIDRQGKLTDALRAQILAATQKSVLEDLYLPFKPKRRTRAMIARERGLEPLALRILAQSPDGQPAEVAAGFVSDEKGVGSVKEALAGARDIVAELCAERADVRAFVREQYATQGALVVHKNDDVTQPTKFEMYYDFREAVRTIPSHRYLAIRRGETETVLRASIEVDAESSHGRIAAMMGRRPASPWAAELDHAVVDAWRRLLVPSIELDVRVELKERADREAVDVFAQNLRSLLLAAPLGARGVIGIDPGQRTGCKVAVVDDTGRLVTHTVLYLVQGDEAVARARKTLAALLAQYKPVAVAVGNGTHGRETEQFARDVLRDAGATGVFVVLVNEAGASVYSASDVAREEFPDLDLTVRGAVSIARRLQDPLAELVKIDPKSIGVGQYQHDVHQPMLARKLEDVVETCVNAVGVELNTASAPLLSYVAGVGSTLAKKIVAHREAHGAFGSRRELLKVSGLGPRAFEQCAGFLRVRGGAHPLDASAVHPERYPVVAAMAKDLGCDVGSLVGNAALVSKVDWTRYVAGDLGEPTLRDILAELQKPGRDPRDTFEPPKFRDDVRTLEDLRPDMWLEGVVTNVTAFGAFVDVGVHQDGLVHISQLSDRFVRDPHEVVKTGDKIRVRVLEIDLVRRRISLSAKTGAASAATQKSHGGDARSGTAAASSSGTGRSPVSAQAPRFANNPFEKLLKKN